MATQATITRRTRCLGYSWTNDVEQTSMGLQVRRPSPVRDTLTPQQVLAEHADAARRNSDNDWRHVVTCRGEALEPNTIMWLGQLFGPDARSEVTIVTRAVHQQMKRYSIGWIDAIEGERAEITCDGQWIRGGESMTERECMDMRDAASWTDWFDADIPETFADVASARTWRDAHYLGPDTEGVEPVVEIARLWRGGLALDRYPELFAAAEDPLCQL